jgi:hypothetical protein
MQPDGRVELPREVRPFFALSDIIEVTQHKWFVGLWRPWSRGKDARRRAGRTGTSKTELGKAADRHHTASGYLRKPAPLSALYLSGYAVECRLKALICQVSGWENLEHAGYELSKRDGREYQLVGDDGHNLELLVDLAELRFELRSLEDVSNAYA